MLLPDEFEHMIRQERQRDLWREREHRHLVRMVERYQTGNQKRYRIIITWIGRQLVKLGSKLQNYGLAAPVKRATTVKYQ